MYEKHIAGLMTLRNRSQSDDNREHFDAAIEIMRAAAPRSAEQERARLNALVCKWLTYNDPRDGGLVWLFESERAAARAEGYVSGVSAVADALTAQAARLSAAKAEIERLLASVSSTERLVNALQTKLSNLRAAAERLYAVASQPARDAMESEAEFFTELDELMPDVLDAIEASR
jgi:DNA repair ATPase RecN